MDIAWAIASTSCYACGAISARRGLLTVSTLAGQLVSLSAGWIILLIISLWAWPREISWLSVGLFGAAGLAGPGIGRLTTYLGLSRLGTTVAIPIQSAVYPFVAVVAGVVLLGETLTIPLGVGAALIATGVVAVACRGSRRRAERITRWERVFLLLPVAAGLAFGAADLLRKQGLVGLDEVPFASFVGVSTALMVWYAAAACLRPAVKVRRNRGLWWFVLHGALSSLAILCLMMALRRGRLSVIGPISASQPVMVAFLSAVLLRDQEVLGWRQIVGMLLTVIGSAVISMAG